MNIPSIRPAWHARWRAASLIAATTFAFACSNAPSDPARAFTTRDSAGIRIAENQAPAWTAQNAWQLDTVPHLDIGGMAGGELQELSNVRDAARLGDCCVIVANSGTGEMRFFDAQGNFIRSVGRQGRGPSEFLSLDRLFFPAADTIIVTDNALRRLSVFDSAGRYVRGASIASTLRAAPTALLHDRTIMARTGLMFDGSTPTSLRRDSLLLVRYDLNGVLVDSLGRFVGNEVWFFAEGGRTIGSNRVFGKQSHVAAAAAGFWFGSGDTHSLTLYALDASVRRIVRFQGALQPVTDQDIARVKQRLDPNLPPEQTAFLGRVFAAMTFPTHFPAHSRLLVDSEQNLWVQDYAADEDVAIDWQVFDPEGRWLGSVRFPPRFDPKQITGNNVLGVWADELDVQHVRAYTLRKPVL